MMSRYVITVNKLWSELEIKHSYLLLYPIVTILNVLYPQL